MPQSNRSFVRSAAKVSAGFICCLLVTSAEAAGIHLAADVDRNGTVSLFADEAGKQTWAWNRGAVMPVNCDADDSGTAPDWSDALVNGTVDEADLAPLVLEAVPSLPGGAVVTVSVDTASASSVRVFLNTGGTWTSLVPGTGLIPAPQLQSGNVRLAVEATKFADASWNGICTITVSAAGAGAVTPTQDSVVLKAAPWLLLPSTQPASKVLVRAMTGRNETFVSQLQALSSTMAATVQVCPDNTAVYNYNDCWMQDAMEIGAMEMSNGRRQNVVLKSNRGSSWLLSDYPRNALMGPDFGWFQQGTYRSTYGGGNAPNGWLDWFGNLEVTPPLPGYPRGRVYYGQNGSVSLDPAIVGMIDAQGVQGPALALDTGWLEIKHVDEMTCWIKTSDTARPYRLLVPDTNAMLALFDQWITDGYGGNAMLTPYYSSQTVSSIRNNTTQRNYNINLQSTRIEPAITSMKTSWALTDADIVRVPAWYASSGASYVPNMVNSALVNGVLLVPNPNGPVVNGQDLLQQAFRNLLSGTGVNVQFLDDTQYHKWSGNVHCGTNVVRQSFSQPLFPSVALSSVADWSLYER